jgi:uncharacterized membrane protein
MIAERSSTGMDANVAAALSYVLGFITGIVFMVVEKESRFVKFHAMQSIVTFGALWVIMFVVSQLPFIGWMLYLLLVPLSFVLWLVLILKAYQGEKFKIPVAGDIAEGQVK